MWSPFGQLTMEKGCFDDAYKANYKSLVCNYPCESN